MTHVDERGFGPLWLWTGIVAGPVAWLVNLSVNNALAPAACAERSTLMLNIVTALALLATAGGWAISWAALRQPLLQADVADVSRGRRRFMALLGLGAAVLFAMQILAGAFPQWMLDVCE